MVEIGAGLGSLTLALAETGAQVTAIEIDRGVVPVLREVVSDRENVEVVEGDAMQLDWSTVLADHPPEDADHRPEAAGCSSPTCPTTSPPR